MSSAARVPALVSAYLSSMVQEHERAAGGWQAEWSIISSVIEATGLAIFSMACVAEGLTADANRMRANIAATHGSIFAERAMMVLAGGIGREAAQKILEEAVQLSRKQGKNLSEVLGEMKAATAHLGPKMLKALEDPEQYLGSADEFRKRLLAVAKPPSDADKE
jgi:3-carboxy-cis,cis-muconate cycloisomerase